jgi:hypothetical protein
VLVSQVTTSLHYMHKRFLHVKLLTSPIKAHQNAPEAKKGAKEATCTVQRLQNKKSSLEALVGSGE